MKPIALRDRSVEHPVAVRTKESIGVEQKWSNCSGRERQNMSFSAGGALRRTPGERASLRPAQGRLFGHRSGAGVAGFHTGTVNEVHRLYTGD
jgi:hypothetical protein